MNWHIRNPILRFVAVAALCALGSAVYATISPVTGVTIAPIMKSGKSGSLRMVISSAEAVDGLNGEMQYDPGVFSNPSVAVDVGSLGFIALGNEVSPGVFRFVLYKNPANQSLDQSEAVLKFSLTPVAGIQGSTMSDVTFSMAASARIVSDGSGGQSAISVQPTVFNPFTVFINGNSAKDWELYE